jgi:hypothetical protein
MSDPAQKTTPAEHARRGAALAELARLDAPEVMDLPPRQTTDWTPCGGDSGVQIGPGDKVAVVKNVSHTRMVLGKMSPTAPDACVKCAGRTYGWGMPRVGSRSIPSNRKCLNCGHSYDVATGRKVSDINL